MSDGDPNRPDVGTGARPPREMPDFLQGGEAPSGPLGDVLGSLRPPPPAEPYIGSWPRPPDQWGKISPLLAGAMNYPGVLRGPFMPQQGDVRSVLQSALGQRGGLGAIGSPQIRALAMGSLRINDRWIKDFIAGNETRLKLLDAQQKRHLDEIYLKQQQESERYGLIMEYYKGKPELRQRLRDAAVELGDTQGPMSMIAALDSPDQTAPERLVAARDRHWDSLAKVRQQHAAIEAQEERTRTAREKAEKAKSEEETARRQFRSLTGTDPPATFRGAEIPAAPPAATPEEIDSPEAAAPSGGGPSEAPAAPAAPTEEPIDRGPSWLRGEAEPSPGAQPQQTAALPPSLPPQQVAAPAKEQDPETAAPYQVAGPAMAPPVNPPVNAPEPAAPARPPGTPPGGIYDPKSDTWTATPPRTAVDDLVDERLLGGKGELGPGYNKAVRAEINTLVAERTAAARTRLEAIYNDKRYNTITNPEERRRAVINAVREVSPRMAQNVQELVDGQVLLNARQIAQWTIPIGLAGKADASFNTQNPRARAEAIRYNTTGQGGRMTLAHLVIHDHMATLRESIERLRQFQHTELFGINFGNRQFLNRIKRIYETGYGDVEDPKVAAAVEAYGRAKSLIDEVAPEIDRVLSGRAPTVHGITTQEANFSVDQGVDILQRKLDDLNELVEARIRTQTALLRASTAGNPRTNLLDMLGRFEGSGTMRSNDFGDPAGTPPNPVLSPLGGRTLSATARDIISRGPPPQAIIDLRNNPSLAPQFESHYHVRAKDYMGE